MESINQPKNKNYFFRDNSNDYNNVMTIQYPSDTKDAENYHNQVFFYERSKTQDPGRKIKEDSFLPKEARPKKIVSLMDDNDYFNREKENIINDNDFSKLLLNSKVGFKNNGYLCYINSIIQVLIHTPIFTKQFKKEIPKSFYGKMITESIYKLCKKIITTSTQKSNSSKRTSSIPTSDLFKAFSSKHNDSQNEYKPNQEEDSQEFLRILLQDLSEESNNAKKSAYQELNFDKDSKCTAVEKYYDYCKRHEDSYILDIFNSQIINISTCKCKFDSFSFDKLIEFPLIFNKTNKSVHVDELIEYFFEDIVVDWEIKCISCRKKRQHKKTIKLTHLPQILILSLQRFNPRKRSKINSDVSFNEILDLTQYVDNDYSQVNKCKYKLYGLVYHKGTLDFGHYYAHININDKWIEFNDQKITVLEELSTKSKYVYLLFYQQIESKKNKLNDRFYKGSYL